MGVDDHGRKVAETDGSSSATVPLTSSPTTFPNYAQISTRCTDRKPEGEVSLHIAFFQMVLTATCSGVSMQVTKSLLCSPAGWEKLTVVVAQSSSSSGCISSDASSL